MLWVRWSQSCTSVRQHLYACLYLCAPASKGLHVFVYPSTKMLAFSRVRLNQNGCLFSCAFTSKCRFFYSYVSVSKWLPFLACVYIKIFCFLSCAHISKCFVIFVCVHIKMVSLFSCRYLSAPVSKCLLVLLSILVLFLRKCSLVRLLWFSISTRITSAHCHCIRRNYSRSTDEI